PEPKKPFVYLARANLFQILQLDNIGKIPYGIINEAVANSVVNYRTSTCIRRMGIVKMKIGVFGRKELVERIKQYTEMDTNIELIPFVFTKAEETIGLVENTYMCDIYLFIGSLPYIYAKDIIDKKRLPTICVAFDEYMILTSFYRMKNDHGQKLDRFSIDVLNPEHVSAILEELRIKNRDIYTYSYLREE